MMVTSKIVLFSFSVRLSFCQSDLVSFFPSFDALSDGFYGPGLSHFSLFSMQVHRRRHNFLSFRALTDRFGAP